MYHRQAYCQVHHSSMEKNFVFDRRLVTEYPKSRLWKALWGTQQCFLPLKLSSLWKTRWTKAHPQLEHPLGYWPGGTRANVCIFTYWSIVALQCYVSFCCITLWIQCKDTYIPSLSSIPPISPLWGHHRALSWAPCAINTAASHEQSTSFMAVYLCQCYSLSLSHPLLALHAHSPFSISASLFLPSKQAPLYHFSINRLHIYVLMIFLFLFLTHLIPYDRL